MPTTRNTVSFRRLLLSSAVALIVASPAMAQDAPVTPPASVAPVAETPTADVGNEIVVTARNRAERLQDVPLSITAISSQQLESANVRNLRDISYLTPGLSINSGGSEFGVAPIIRGQTNLSGGAGDPNVAVFVDGVYLSNNSAINLGLVDIERVEVVKGPVSALYGHNAFAGAINYVSKRPSLTEITGKISAFVGNDVQRGISGSIGIPLIKDVLAVRVAAGYEKFGGSYKDDVNGARAGGFKKRDGQVSLLFKPDDAFTASASYYYGKDTFGISAIAYNANNCGSRAAVISPLDPSGLGFSAYCGRFDPDQHPVEVPALPNLGAASGNDREAQIGTLNLSYDFGPATLTSLTGYTKVDQQRLTDFIGRRNGIPFALVPVVGQPSTANLYEVFGSNTNTKDFSQEVRLQSDASQRIRGTLGAFYYKGKLQSRTIIGIDSSTIPAGRTFSASGNGFGQAIDYVTADGSFSTVRITDVRQKDRQYSFFAGLEGDITDSLTATGEYRHTAQKRNQLIVRNTGCPSYITTPALAVGAFVTCIGSPVPYINPFGPEYTAKFKFDNYRGSLKYKISSGSNLYASIANGTKAGGFNTRATIQEDLQFDPEKNTTYEIGSKNSFLNNRLQLNVALYHIDTSNIQISGPAAAANNPGLVTKNFGSVKTDGFEIETAARVARGVKVNAGLAYSNPKFGDDAFDYNAGAACRNLAGTVFIAQCAGQVIVAAPGTPLNPNPAAATRLILALDGNHLPRTSNWQYTAGVDLDGDINADWRWMASANFRYESKQYAFNNNISTYGPRTIVNARIGVESGRFNVAAYVNNLTDDHTPETVSVNARLSDFGGDLDGYLPIGRQFGIIVGAKF